MKILANNYWNWSRAQVYTNISVDAFKIFKNVWTGRAKSAKEAVLEQTQCI